VIRPPSESRPGKKCLRGSSSRRRPSAASWRTTVATNIFVTLPTRKRSPACIFTRASTFAYPAVAVRVRFPSRAYASAPGTPADTTRSTASVSGAGRSPPQPARKSSVTTRRGPTLCFDGAAEILRRRRELVRRLPTSRSLFLNRARGRDENERRRHGSSSFVSSLPECLSFLRNGLCSRRTGVPGAAGSLRGTSDPACRERGRDFV
jgi:hypothetical protein